MRETRVQAIERPTRNFDLVRGLVTGVLVAAFATQGAVLVWAESERQMSDPAITNAVSDALFTRHGVPAYVIDVETTDGIVALSGAVNNIMAKDRAVRVAETVKGVRSVVDRLEVTESDLSDEQVRKNVRSALRRDAATDAWELESTVSDGKVTLEGTVESWQEKQLAAKVAKSVRGVRSLKNEVKIDYKTERADPEIRADVVKALRWDALVDDALINVKVNNEKVMLTGTVGSAAEKRRARTDAWVMGVDSVDVSNLEVESWTRDERFRKDKYVTKSDARIRDAIEDALLYDPRVLSTAVDVSVSNGVVTLDGEVDNLKAKQSAARTARHTVGVWRVKNRIDVRPSTPSDPVIANRIRQALVRDPYVERFEVDVWVDNGEANLSGTVDNYFEKLQAGDVAAGIYGVVMVDNNLVVENEYDAITYDPYVYDDTYLYDYDWYVYPDRYTTTRSDWEIREDVVDEMWWSPFVDSNEVTVTVDNGVVTLTGTVETWNERQAATENAYEGGAVAVDNDLLVAYGPDYYDPAGK